MDGRAATMTSSDAWNPDVSSSNFSNPLGTPVIDLPLRWSVSMRSIVGHSISLIRVKLWSRRWREIWKMRDSAVSRRSLACDRPSYASVMMAVEVSISRRRMDLSRRMRQWNSRLAAVGAASTSSARYSGPAHDAQLAAALQLVPQRDVVDHDAPLGQRAERAEQPPVLLPIKDGVVDQLHRPEGRVLLQQHRAQHRLLRLRAPGSGAAGRGVSGRVAVVRYGCHPRWASSSSGS